MHIAVTLRTMGLATPFDRACFTTWLCLDGSVSAQTFIACEAVAPSVLYPVAPLD